MNRDRLIATAALLAGLVFAHSATAQQSMYRCGNRYQDKPCESGEKGRVVGTTGTPAPAAKGGSDKPEKRAERSRLDAAHDLDMQYKARDCLKLRRRLRETKQQYYRVREEYQRDMQQRGCPGVGHEGSDLEKKCAGASSEEMAEACGAYEKANPNKGRKR